MCGRTRAQLSLTPISSTPLDPRGARDRAEHCARTSSRHARVVKLFARVCALCREELEAKAKGIEDPWREAWLDAPFGTETNPVEVTSEFSERIVGVPDPDDDSLVR